MLVRILLIMLLSMQDLSHNKRIVIVFVKDINNEVYRMQVKELEANQSGLDERDIVAQSGLSI